MQLLFHSATQMDDDDDGPDIFEELNRKVTMDGSNETEMASMQSGILRHKSFESDPLKAKPTKEQLDDANLMNLFGVDSIQELTKDQVAMFNMWKDIQFLKQMVISMKPPTDSVFMTKSMESKLDGVYQAFTNAKSKLLLDLSHKPLFVDRNPCPENRMITINEEEYPGETDEFYKKNLKKMEDYWLNYLFEVFHDETHSYAALVVYLIIVASIIVSVITTILGSVKSLDKYGGFFQTVELIVTVCFTIEYLSKLLVVRNKLLYLVRPMNVLDLLAILPFYITEGMDEDSDGKVGAQQQISSVGGILRSLRLARIAKIRQLATPYTNIIMYAMIDSVWGTGSAVGIFLFIGCVMTGSLVYAAEQNMNNGFDNIPMGMWYALVTMTTVGYGDLYPESFFGLLLGTLCILAGLILMSLIIMVIGQYYILHLTAYEKSKEDIKNLLWNYAGEDRRRYRGLLKRKGVKELYDMVKTDLRILEDRKMQ